MDRSRLLAPNVVDPPDEPEDGERDPDDRRDRTPHHAAEDEHRAERDYKRRERVGRDARMPRHAKSVHRYTSEKMTAHTASTKCQYTLTAASAPSPRRAKFAQRESTRIVPIAMSRTPTWRPC